MRYSVFGYADIGTQTGRALTALSKLFYQFDVLDCVYPRGVTHECAFPVKKPIPGGSLIPKMMTGIDQYITNFPHRTASESLYDYFASRYAMTDTADIHFHYLPGHLRSLEAAHANETPVVVRGPTELIELSDQRLQREAEEYNISLENNEFYKRRVQRRKETLKQADRVIALSKFVQQSYVEGGIDKQKISVIPLGIDTSEYPMTEEYDSEGFSAVFVGSINLLKGIPYLIEAWNQLDDDESRLTLCGNVESRVSEIIEPLPSSVETPGFVDPRQYLLEADVFVFPSLSEGFPKAPLEAMATGTPVIVTANSGINDIITDGVEGFIIPARDSTELADKIAHVKNNPQERKKMGKKAYKTAKVFTWERCCKRIATILENKLSETRR